MFTHGKLARILVECRINMHICRIATVPFFLLSHLKGQIVATVEHGHSVTLVSSNGKEAKDLMGIADVSFQPIEIPRKISPLADLRALIKLYRFFRDNKFDLVHSTTPKAGFLAAIAGWLAKIPIRLHTFTGQPWMTKSGMVRMIAKLCDKWIIRLNTQCYADSFSQRDFLITQRVANPGHIKVLGSGSLAGVDLRRFAREHLGNRENLREMMGIPTTAQLVIFIGRVTRDKGVIELIQAVELLRQKGFSSLFLMLVGPFEQDQDPLPDEYYTKIHSSPYIQSTGYTSEPERYLAAADILCLPSYREGFGNVVIEAAAMGIPAVATRIVGLTDAIKDGVTGILVPPRDPDSLAQALTSLLSDEDYRKTLGEAARTRAQKEFDMDTVNAHVLDEYQRLDTAMHSL